MEKDLLKTTEESSTRWDASTYVSDWKDIIRLFNGREFFLDVIEQINLPKDASVLEIGIGGGKWSSCFSIMGYRVTAMDNNPDMLVQAQRNFPNIMVDYRFGDIRVASYTDLFGKFDLVFNEGVLEHFLDREERISCVQNMKRCCIGGGYVYFLVPFLSDQPDEHRYTSLKEMDLEVREAGLEPVLVDIGVFQTSTQIYNMLRVLAKRIS